MSDSDLSDGGARVSNAERAWEDTSEAEGDADASDNSANASDAELAWDTDDDPSPSLNPVFKPPTAALSPLGMSGATADIELSSSDADADPEGQDMEVTTVSPSRITLPQIYGDTITPSRLPYIYSMPDFAFVDESWLPNVSGREEGSDQYDDDEIFP